MITSKKGAKSPRQPNMDFHFQHKPPRLPQMKENYGIPVLRNLGTIRFSFLANNRLSYLWVIAFDILHSNSGNELQSVGDHLYIS